MTDPYRALDQKPYDSKYVLLETVLDYPIEKVWPQALKIGSWMNAHRLETLAGEAGKVGHFERVHPLKIGADVPLPHYHLYGIEKIIPFKLIALEVLPEKGGSYGETRSWASFDSILFTDLGGKTQLTFYMIDVYQGKGDEAFHQREDAKLERAGDLLKRYFDNLKQQVQSMAETNPC
jgi:hypothetical protein